MEGISNMAFTGNGIAGDESFVCNAPIKTADFQELSDYTLDCSKTKNIVEVSQNVLKGMSDKYEDSSIEPVESGCANSVTLHEIYITPKATSPTIFENAVKAVKNLFSPAKGHGLFTRNAPQLECNELEGKKGMTILSESICDTKEEISLIHNITSPPHIRLENILCLKEEDANLSSLKSCNIDTHDNTNDSYTSTLSRIDDSFQSTVTHLDGYIQNEVVKSNEEIVPTQNSLIMNGSLKESDEVNNSSLDNTLKNYASICSQNRDLNIIFEECPSAKIVVENTKGEESNLAERSNFRESSDLSTSEQLTEEPKQNSYVACISESMASQIREEYLRSRKKETASMKTKSASTPPMDSAEDVVCADIAAVDIASEKLNELTRKSAGNVTDIDSYSCATEDIDVDEENLTRLSTTSHSSETDCSLFCGRNENMSEKTANAKCASDLEKNFSTSTIIITKSELDGSNLNGGKDKLCQKSHLLQTNSEPLLFDQVNFTDCLKSQYVQNDHLHEAGKSHSEKNKPFQNMTEAVLGNLIAIADNGSGVKSQQKQLGKEYMLDYGSLTNFKNELNIVANEISSHSSEQLPGDAPSLDYKVLNFNKDLYLEDEILLKPGYCQPSEARIPLASQKSYTVLHNPNPDLNRPVVCHSSCDVEAAELNDIILGNNAFSDLNMAYVKDNNSAELISDNSSSSSTIIATAKNLSDVYRLSSTATAKIDKEFRSDDRDKVNINPVNRAQNVCLTKNINEILIGGRKSVKSDYSAPVTSPERFGKYFDLKSGVKKYFEPEESFVSLNIASKDSEMKKAVNSDIDQHILKAPTTKEDVLNGSCEGSLTLINENTLKPALPPSNGTQEQHKIHLKKAIEDELTSPMRSILHNVVCKGSFAGSDTLVANISGDCGAPLIDRADMSLEKIVNSPLRKEFCKDQLFMDFHSVPNTRHADIRINNLTDPNNSSSGFKETESDTFVSSTDTLIRSLERLKITDNFKEDSAIECGMKLLVKDGSFGHFGKSSDPLASGDEAVVGENLKNTTNDLVSGGETDLAQFIQEQFTAHDIEKICCAVGDMPELNLSKNIVMASQQFDKSFQNKVLHESSNSTNVNSTLLNENNGLSSACFDFLDSIKGKPSSRDYSRESLYVKFDPLIQKKSSQLDESEGDKENLIVSPVPRNSNSSDPLISITPLKQTINAKITLSPITPSSQKSESKLSAEKWNKLRELENEILQLRELYLQREEVNKEKINNYESEIAKLTGKACVLEDKLKESGEREKSLVKKLTVQNDSMNKLKCIIEEYLAYISKLTDQIEAVRLDCRKQTEVLTEERDYYMNHLQSTEQAFSDVHSKYEKCKKAVEVFKRNEETYKANIEELKENVEQYSEKVKDIQENATREVNRLFDKMNEMKVNHAQEISRFKAQLRKTELTVQTVQEALEQKIKENKELAGICDELIEGKKCNR